MPRKDYSNIDKATATMLGLWGERSDVRRYMYALGFSEHAIKFAMEDRTRNGLNRIMTKVGADYLADPGKFVKWAEGYERIEPRKKRDQSLPTHARKCWQCGVMT